MKAKTRKLLDSISFMLVFVGAVNWGLVVFDINLVTLLLSGFGMFVVKLVYGLVGVAGVLQLLLKYKVLK